MEIMNEILLCGAHGCFAVLKMTFLDLLKPFTKGTMSEIRSETERFYGTVLADRVCLMPFLTF
jgi:hypothetical protein